jgi:subfamily B ATP-binding cassette protein MsbA
MADPVAAPPAPRRRPLGRLGVRFWRHFLPYWKHIVVVLIASGLYSVGVMGRALVAKLLVDKVLVVAEKSDAIGGRAPGPWTLTLPSVFEPSAAGTVFDGPPARRSEAPAARPVRPWEKLIPGFARSWYESLRSTFHRHDVALSMADRWRYLKIICGFAFFLALLATTAHFVKVYVERYVVTRVTVDIRNRLYRHLLNLSLAYFHRQKTGDLLSRMTHDLQDVRKSMDFLVGDVIEKPMLVLVGIVFCFWTDWRLGLASFLVIPILAIPIKRAGKRIMKGSRARQLKLSDITEALTQTFSGIRIIKAFRTEREEIRDFEQKNRQYFKSSMKVARAKAQSNSIMEFLYGAGVPVLAFLGGYLVLVRQDLKPGELMAFFIALAQMYQPLKVMARNYNTIQESVPGAERLFELLDEKPSVREELEPVELTGVRTGIAFRAVGFTYGGSESVLQDVDFHVRPGVMVAIVGPSGAGKSTMLDLIARFYDPTEGAIEIDGVDLRRFSFSSIYRNIAIVSQDPFLFNTTIEENIRYGKPEASDEEVIEAARAANIHDFIASLPDGYRSVVGERGVLLSGGQRQRITIARAILKNAPILLLDEATSSLDTESERLIQAALDRLMQGRSSFVIAHRLSTVRHADLILVLVNGRIVERGTHDQLIAETGVYRRLCDLQLGIGGPEPAAQASAVAEAD